MPRNSLLCTSGSASEAARVKTRRWLTAALLAMFVLAGTTGATLAQGTVLLRRLPPIVAPPMSSMHAPLETAWPTFEAYSAHPSTTRLAAFQEALPIPDTGPDGFELLATEDIVPIEIPLQPLGGCGSCGACGSCGSCSSCGSCGCWCDNCDQRRTRVGRFFCGVYHSVCCPDPCYEPCWKGLADSAFFTEAARPVTQSRFRWDAGLNLILADRAEYFWARSGGGGRGRPAVETGLTYHDLTHYNEVAHGRFSAFMETTYRSLDPEVNTHTAGFGDLIAGTKSLLFDCELMQVTFQTKFITPVGNAPKGLGTGHLSIEPSLIVGLNLGPRSYLQAQVAEWIPIGGDPTYSGALVHYHLAYNRTLLGRPDALHVIGSTELNGWTFQDGAYSDPNFVTPQSASGETYLSGAAGLRMIVCEKLDFGFSFAHAFTDNHWAEQLFRSEMRVRF